MEQLVLEGVRPYDGAYPLNLEDEPLTIREWGWIKKLAGYMPATASDGFAAGDPELMLALAVIMLRRAGKIRVEELEGVADSIADKPAGSLRWETVGGEGADDDDPTASSTGNSTSSSNGSSESSESSGEPRDRTGTPASVSSPSVPTISAT